MNEKFHSLPEQKRRALINAGYRVFAHNSYRKSPMREIAEAAGISKALLFHYFRDKRELYLFLWRQSGELTRQALQQHGCYGQTDLFESMRRGLRAKVELMRRYPDMGAFVLRAYYETDPAVCGEIYADIAARGAFREDIGLCFDEAQFVPGLDLQQMCRDMYLASEGYLWESLHRGSLTPEQMEQDFSRMLDFWESVYRRKEDAHDGDSA